MQKEQNMVIITRQGPAEWRHVVDEWSRSQEQGFAIETTKK